MKGFEKILLKPGETKTLTIPLDNSAFAFYDDSRHEWVAEQDDFEIRVGGSSRDLPLTSTYHLPATVTLP